MIDPIAPDLQAAGLKMAIRDIGGSMLTLQVVKNAVGIGVSEGATVTAIHMSREDREALIEALIELREDETLL